MRPSEFPDDRGRDDRYAVMATGFVYIGCRALDGFEADAMRGAA
jgi:hypothetical protein